MLHFICHINRLTATEVDANDLGSITCMSTTVWSVRKRIPDTLKHFVHTQIRRLSCGRVRTLHHRMDNQVDLLLLLWPIAPHR